jgi:diguanylate cyclase (GGDEF)-like protein
MSAVRRVQAEGSPRADRGTHARPRRGLPRPRFRFETHAWMGFLAIGVALVAAYSLLDGTLVRDGVYAAIGIVSVVAVRRGTGMHRPALRRPWDLSVLGLSLWVVGDALYTVHEDVLGRTSYPSIGDAFYLAGYPALCIALLSLARSRRSARDQAGILDGWTVAIGLSLVAVVVLVRPSFTGGALLPDLVSVAYPLGDIMLVTGLVRVVMAAGARSTAIRLLTGAVVMLLLSDALSTLYGLHAVAVPGWLDLLWLLSYVCWGAAALHPSMASIAAPVDEVDPAFSRRRMVAAGLATMVAPIVLAVEQSLHLRLDVWPVVAGAIVMFGLVVSRMSVAIEQIAVVSRQSGLLQQQLEHEATHDALTQLPNRAHGLALTEQALEHARTTGATVALLFCDLDGFKQVNDTMGHRTGDEVLQQVALRLRSAVHPAGMVMRLGGDEFVAVLRDVAGGTEAVALAQQLVEVVSEPLKVTDGTAVVGTSIGVAVAVRGAAQADDLLNEADVAAYRAKAAGKGRAELYDDTMREDAHERVQLERILRRAIDEDELVLHYQPIIDSLTGDVEGYEALVRWERPGEGTISPAQFLPLAESSNLICDLDAWVLRRAAEQLGTWTSLFGNERLFVSVNISSRHVAQTRVVRDVARALEFSGIRPERLVLELDEAVLTDRDRSVPNLHALRDLGVRISVDDFGASISQLARLADMPLDVVKIDSRFLDLSSQMSGKLLHLMIQGAHAVGLSAVAQGVEHDRQLATLRALDCESVQGFHIAHPMTAAQAEEYHCDLLVDRFSGLLSAPSPAEGEVV